MLCRGRICLVFCLLGTSCPTSNGQGFAFRDARALIGAYCLPCHQGAAAAGALDLGKFNSPKAISSEPQIWDKVFLRVRLGEMPPKAAPGPSKAEREQFAAWIRSNLRAAACPTGTLPGPEPIRRLN